MEDSWSLSALLPAKPPVTYALDQLVLGRKGLKLQEGKEKGRREKGDKEEKDEERKDGKSQA